MVAEESRRTVFVNFSSSDHRHQLNDVFLFCFKAEAVEIEKKICCRKCGAFVPVSKRMVLGNAEKIGCGEFAKIGLSICFLLKRSVESRFQHPFVANAGSPTMETQLFAMQRLNKFARMMLSHLASAR